MSDATTPSFSAGPPLPEMREAVLSNDDLAALVADLQALTQIQSVIGKAGARQHSSDSPLTIETAAARLTTGTLPAAQVHYRYDGSEWTDTLIRSPQGIKLVRCQHPQGELATSRSQ